MLRCLLLLALIMLARSAQAQVPSVIVLELSVEDGGVVVTDGVHRVDVLWYDRASGGTPLWREAHDVVVREGRYRVELGRTAGLPTTLLQGGQVWVGLSVDGVAEPSPRRALLPVPYAHRSAHADVADRLAPTVTGVVTSINEIGGALHLRGDSTVRIDRRGNTLHFSARSGRRRHGTVLGPCQPPVRIAVGGPISSEASITVHVEGGTSPIAASVVAVDGQTLVVTTSAALTAGERLRWEVVDAD